MIYQLEGFAPQIAGNCFIAPNATIIGDAKIAEHASIWFNVVIRADLAEVSIGKNCLVGGQCPRGCLSFAVNFCSR